MYKLDEIKIQLELLCYSDRNLAWTGLSQKKGGGSFIDLHNKSWKKQAWEAVGFEPQVSYSVSELYSGNYSGTP